MPIKLHSFSFAASRFKKHIAVYFEDLLLFLSFRKPDGNQQRGLRFAYQGKKIEPSWLYEIQPISTGLELHSKIWLSSLPFFTLLPLQFTSGPHRLIEDRILESCIWTLSSFCPVSFPLLSCLSLTFSLSHNRNMLRKKKKTPILNRDFCLSGTIPRIRTNAKILVLPSYLVPQPPYLSLPLKVSPLVADICFLGLREEAG